MGVLETTVRDVMAAFDRQDFDGVRSRLAPDAQGVDEIARHWLRDAGEIDAYFKQLEGAVEGVSTSLSELREDDWGDAGVVTGWMEQEYTLNGESQHVSAPFTFVLRRLEGEWRVAVIHAVALPEES